MEIHVILLALGLTLKFPGIHICVSFFFLKKIFFMITSFDCEHRSSTHLCIQSFCLKRAANQSDFIYLLISANKKVCLVS